jgi:DNA-nicking Smr family endonuclease
LAKDKSKNQEFRNNPFKPLKGITPAPTDRVPKPKTSEVSDRPAGNEQVDDEDLFSREMSLLGVSQQSRNEEEEVRDKSLPGDIRESEGAIDRKPAPITEEDEFLSALGQMDAVFQDEFPLEETPVATPGRMKQLRHGRLVPDGSLDLHGLSREQAREKARFFLEDSVYQGRKTVLVITGRGKGSPDGPVLRNDMESYLANEAKSWVVEWGRAPARYGGEGALVVFLKNIRRHRK